MNIQKQAQQKGSGTRALTLLANIIGATRGVQIVYVKDMTASTDGKTIFLPTLSDCATEDDAVLLTGLVDHEAMHCKFTDFEFIKSNPVQLAIKKNPIIFPLLNTFEDVWGEREQAKIYPGCFRNIKKSVQVMIDKGLYGASEGSSTPEYAIRNYLLQGLLARLYECDRLDRFAKLERNALIGFVGQELTDKIWAVALKVDDVKSTKACYQLVLELFSLITDELNKSKSSKGDKKREQQLTQITEKAPKDCDIGSILEEALTKNGATTYMGEPVEERPYVVRRRAEPKNEISDELRQLVRPVAIGLGTRLECLLESRVNADVAYGRNGRKLAARKLPGISTGRFSVFRTDDEVDGIDTAVSMLVDLSSSMFRSSIAGTKEKPETIAKSAVIGIGDVLDQFDIPFSVMSYGTNCAGIKSFEDNWRTRRACVDYERMGSTNTSRSLEFAANDIAQRREKRRIVVLLTDGDSDDNNFVVPVLNELTSLQIEFTSIFIGYGGSDLESMMQSALYPVQRVKQIEALPAAVFAAIEKAI